jgi:hypothetical protein
MIDWWADPMTTLVGGPGQDSYVCGGNEDVVVVDYSPCRALRQRLWVAVFDV